MEICQYVKAMIYILFTYNIVQRTTPLGQMLSALYFFAHVLTMQVFLAIIVTYKKHNVKMILPFYENAVFY